MMMIVLMISQNDAPKWNALQRIPKRSSSDLNRSHVASCVKPDSSGFTQIPKINAFPSRNKRRFNSKINTVCLAIWWQYCRKVIDDCVSEFKWIEKASLEMDACVDLVNRGDFRPWQGKLNTCGAFCTWMTPCAWRCQGEKRQTSTEYQFNQLSGGKPTICWRQNAPTGKRHLDHSLLTEIAFHFSLRLADWPISSRETCQMPSKSVQLNFNMRILSEIRL